MTQMLIIIAVLLVALFLIERRWPSAVTRFEEGMLAILMAALTLVSFTQVVMRYGFSGGWGGALEFTRILFAWLILFGMSYAIKINSHLGVDIVLQLVPQRTSRILAVVAALACVLYALILLYADWLQLFGINARGGALDYWSKMFKVGIGLDDLRYPDWAQNSFGLQERVQRWIAYLILPIGLALFMYRSLQAAINIARGNRQYIIASHEAEDLVAENKNAVKD
ncbi:TRAP transporter small permease [Devosia rhodophyticola]|uniref:TRAP transporter small permease protein n=1 Tax=Devosia rhodophyticola TaxID=3026423 RepID=A0ABY7Z040_9HYPH|nr:TRAP transporter small permease [Devosia rhodophyticola]WDR06995.1 TRAP transporter small permease [Devosia rhodophyticola]